MTPIDEAVIEAAFNEGVQYGVESVAQLFDDTATSLEAPNPFDPEGLHSNAAISNRSFAELFRHFAKIVRKRLPNTTPQDTKAPE